MRRTFARVANRVTFPALAGAATAGVVVLCTLVLYVRTMPPTITWWFGGADSGDLVTAAVVFGIPHPSGYPLFVLLGHLVLRLPLGPVDPAGQINVMNAIFAALGAGMLTLGIGELGRSVTIDASLRWGAAGLAAATVAVTQLYWSQAIIGEVYALHVALAALVLWLWARRFTLPVLRGAAHGLALANHLTSALMLVAAVIAFMPPWNRPATRAGAGSVRWFVVGLLVPLVLYTLLPLRAAQHPASNWGDPRTVDRFVAHVTGQQYRGHTNWRDPAGALRDAASLLRFMLGDLPPWVVPAAAVGYVGLRRTAPSYALFTAIVLVGTVLGTALYRVPDRVPYLLPAYLVLGLWGGFGLISLASELLRRPVITRLPTSGARLVVGGAALIVLLSTLWGVRTGMRVNLRGDDSALQFARVTLTSLPNGATYYSARDDVTFTLWYAQRVLGIRPDVRVVDIRNPDLTPP